MSRLGASWGRLGTSWERLGGVLGASLGRLRRVLEASWTSWKRLASVLEASWRRLAGVLEASWRPLGDEDRKMARKSQLKPQKYHFYLDSVTSTARKRNTYEGDPRKFEDLPRETSI